MRLIVFLFLTTCLTAQPRRIISTGPSITEILFALGLGDRVVGATQYCMYPPAAQKIPRIGTWMTPNMEAIVAARPDLVIMQRTAIHDGSNFRALKLKTIEVQLDTIASIYTAITQIGSAAGTPQRADQLVKSIRGELEAVRSRVAGKPPTSVMFIVGRTPQTLEGMIAAGGKSFHTELIEAAGGRNVFADSSVGYPKIVHEEILSRDPEVIIDMGEHADASGVTDAQQEAEIRLWSKYPSLRAYRERRIHIVASDVYVHPGPRVPELARKMARMLHPELFH